MKPVSFPSLFCSWPRFRRGSSLLCCLLVTLLAWGSAVAAEPLLEQRVDELFAKLTQDEKLTLLSGTSFSTRAIKRLGIPEMCMVDAGQGVRGGMDGTTGSATLFPSGAVMAATWDTDLLSRIGQAIGEEALNKGPGSQVLLGPAVNIHRTPLGGRNGEYFSEDPYLASRLAVAFIRGLQSTGAAACVKHYACNNQEDQRTSVDVKVSERALREIYLPAFEAAVKEGHVWTIMASYNRINGRYATANPYLLTDVLKKGWGFDGLVMSDWGAVYSLKDNVVQAGTDLEMPGKLLTVEALKAGLADGSLTQAAVDDSVRRVLRTVIRTGLMDAPHKLDAAKVNSKEHQQLAYKAATEGIILLKNDCNLLPLDLKKTRKIAVIGWSSGSQVQPGALGSPWVNSPYVVSPLKAISDRAKKEGAAVVSVLTFKDGVVTPASAFRLPGKSEPGLQANYFNNGKGSGAPLLSRVERQIDFSNAAKSSPLTAGGANEVVGLKKDDYSVRWETDLVSQEAGEHVLTLTPRNGAKVTLDGQEVAALREHSDGLHFTVDMKPGQPRRLMIFRCGDKKNSDVKLEWITPSMTLFPDAVAAAKDADAAVLVVGTNGQESEGFDRESLTLPAFQENLICEVTKVNPRTIVVLNTGGPVATATWLPWTPALLQMGFPGMEGGNALAAILFGDVNPSAKLPDTMGLVREDYPDAANYPGEKGVEKYEEGIFVGYRYFDKEGRLVAFPFGHGLSYTTFLYGRPRLSSPSLSPDGSVTVSMDVTNTGSRAGDEVVQLYVHDPMPKVDKAPRELKGFARVSLQPGEKKTVTIELRPRALAYCDVADKQWKADAGNYDIEIGASSRDIRQRVVLKLDATFTEAIPFMQEQWIPDTQPASQEADGAKK